MATAKKPTLPALSVLTTQAIALVASVLSVFGRATETYREFALLLVMGRGAKNPDGTFAFPIEIGGVVVADWAGKSQAYRDWTSKVYADAGIDNKVLLRKVQSSVRNHVSEVNREFMTKQGIDFVLYGMDKASQSEKQKANKAKSIVRSAKGSPAATAAALSSSLLDPKGPKDGAVQLATLINNQMATLAKHSVDLDQQH